jgi:hypothetical protein
MESNYFLFLYSNKLHKWWSTLADTWISRTSRSPLIVSPMPVVLFCEVVIFLLLCFCSYSVFCYLICFVWINVSLVLVVWSKGGDFCSRYSFFFNGPFSLFSIISPATTTSLWLLSLPIKALHRILLPFVNRIVHPLKR